MEYPVTYDSIVQYMNSLEFAGMKLGLTRMRNALKIHGNPDKKLKIIHIAGTNGKGSVAAMTAKILQTAGYKVGLFTSPHLVDVRERIRVNWTPISKDEFREAFVRAKDKSEDLTFFELITLMAVMHFVQRKVDYAVFEVGLGGTYDATNFEQSLMSVITRIGLDHTDMLGETIQQIAQEKCNIIKPGQTVVTTSANSDVMDVIDRTAHDKGCRLVVAEESSYPTGLKGQFQKQNAGIAVAIAKELGVSEENIKKGLLDAEWPGRIEWYGKNVLMDSAHNIPGLKALVDYVSTLKYEKLFIVFAVSRNKKYNEMLKILPPHEELIFTQTSVTRRLPVEDIPKDLECKKVRDPVDALAYAKSRAGKNDLVLVCGSIFLVADIKAALERVKA
ncbi:bifunctional folylpolyglutamate synthase/dihydrofolate synthase [Candidatus Woesearchaeota archaeon]|nr:bifunctional folylpolyglutamate synthase/dihydrofolate synthase [Candidatus Woesearchaeota archaeon]